jgi:glyoxylase-like metal-dependent hydrolase (beta-lactamase superfamily II)
MHLVVAALLMSYEVFAIRYATIPQFPVSSLVQGADAGRKIDIAMMVWLVRGGGRNILVDSGFYRDDLVKRWKPAGFVRPDEAVARAGVRAEDITDVIITHAHWDHAGGTDLFPKARIWIQKDEYEYYSARAGKAGVTVEDMAALKNAGKRLHLIDGDQEILPGIRVYTGGRHTFASQYVSVTTKDGPVVLASDNVYLYENLDKHAPIAQTLDAKSNLAAQDRMKSIVHDIHLIVPGHDPAVLTRFRRVAEGVVRIE